jgi:hypothetical protein
MGSSRFAFVLGIGALMVAACSGSANVDIGGPQSTGSSSGQAGSGADTTGGSSGDLPSSGSAGSGSTSGASTGSSGGSMDASMDATVGDDASNPMDASTSDSSAGDAGDDASPPPDDAAPPPDDGGNTFACGPSKRCDADTQYCRINPRLLPVAAAIVPVTDGSIVSLVTYSCLTLPQCDGARGCKCVDPNKVCACSESMGDIVEDCSGTGGGPTPL